MHHEKLGFCWKEMYKTFELMTKIGTSHFLGPYFTILNYKSESNEVENKNETPL